MGSYMVWPKVIPLNGAYCCNFWSLHRRLHCIVSIIECDWLNLKISCFFRAGKSIPSLPVSKKGLPVWTFDAWPTTTSSPSPMKKSEKFMSEEFTEVRQKVRTKIPPEDKTTSDLSAIRGNIFGSLSNLVKFIISGHITHNLRCEIAKCKSKIMKLILSIWPFWPQNIIAKFNL